MRRLKILGAPGVFVVLASLGALTTRGLAFAQQPTVLTAAADAPRYKVDPSWPKPLPNSWVFGNIHGIAVDKNDHIWALTSPRTVAADRVSAP